MNKIHPSFILLFAGLSIAVLSITNLSPEAAFGNAASAETRSGLTVPSTPQPPIGLSTPQKIQAARIAGQIDPDKAALYLAYALRDPARLPVEYASDVPWDGTLPLLQLQQSLKTTALRSQTVAVVEAYLSNTCDVNSAPLPNTTSSDHFYIEYGTIGGGLALASYITSLETSWATEVTAFGWAAPPVKASNPAPGNKYHVRIESLGTGLYGFVSSQGTFAGLVQDNPNTSWNDVDAYASCMVLNGDYSTFPGTPQTALDATTAHEFNHSIQYGIGALSGSNTPDANFIEGGATWMEDEVFDQANDNYNYLWPQFNMCMGQYGQSPYPYWITFRGMVERYGTGVAGGGEDVMQAFWELTSQNAASNLEALDQALASKGVNLAAAYHDYAIAVRFNKPCGGSLAYPYCLEEGPDYPALPTFTGGTVNHGNINGVNDSFTGAIQDDYALNWIGLPTSASAYNVTLSNNSSGGQLRGSLVCDRGASLVVQPLPEVVGAGASTTFNQYDPAGCSSIVLVLTNQAQTADNPTTCALRNYQVAIAPGSPPNVTPTPTPQMNFIYYFPFAQINTWTASR